MIDNRIAKECYLFAVQVTDTTFNTYSKRQIEVSKDKLIQQHYIAKLTEWYVYYYLIEKNYLVQTPDMRIYSEAKKNYDADLYVFDKKINIHVKSCKPKLKSVLFEKAELKLFTKNDFICIVLYESLKNMKIISFKNALDYEYNNPIKNMPTKKAIYL